MSRRLLLSDAECETLASTPWEPLPEGATGALLSVAVESDRLRSIVDECRDPYNLHLIPYAFRSNGGATLRSALSCAELIAAMDQGELDPRDEGTIKEIKSSLDALRETVAVASMTGLPMPVMSAALHFFLQIAYREERQSQG
ncbi:MAG: hypothetical protein SPI16_07175 [Porphyromonas sp.]|uniref:hypothetical protein n=1 Tax=Porphyromonas sp. TaxID=1924944 RepID=UPI002A9196F4|nr:hypothetical protein [Porphyromonas sp.]MDD7468254.1 hypothetical protein [Bacteroidales bacterium]MDY6102806.1 hypothetical protein [Porphyromonas sp.]